MEVQLKNGQIALVSPDKYDLVKDLRWYVNPYGYAFTMVERKHTSMHRLIMGCEIGDGRLVDHINRNTLDNRTENLRFATKAQNATNAAKRRGNTTSAYKGVSWNKRRSKWVAYINIDGRRQPLGYFTDELSAARAYNAAAIRHHGQYARINNI